MSSSFQFLAFSFPLGGPDGLFLFGLYGLYFIALAVLHLALSSAVYSDAHRLHARLGSGTSGWIRHVVAGGLARRIGDGCQLLVGYETIYPASATADY
jgi:hypothetical protein